MIARLGDMSAHRKVLSVASEIYPLVKTGGLADVVGALPGALAAEGGAAHAAARLSRRDRRAARTTEAAQRRSTSCSAARRRCCAARPAGSTCSCSTRRICSTATATPMSAPTGTTGRTMRCASPRSRARRQHRPGAAAGMAAGGGARARLAGGPRAGLSALTRRGVFVFRVLAVNRRLHRRSLLQVRVGNRAQVLGDVVSGSRTTVYFL